MASRPRDSVFTTVLCKEYRFIADLQSHLDRLYNHAERLRIKMPDNCLSEIATCIDKIINIEGPNNSNQELCLLSIRYHSKSKKFSVDWREISELRFSDVHGITLNLPKWFGEVTGTKHGDWQPYLEARNIVEDQGADVALLVDDFSIVDSDRANVLLVDENGVAWISDNPLTVDGITQQIIVDNIQNLGVPVSKGRLNERIVARSTEVVVLGTGLGCCRIKTIDGETIGEDSSIIFRMCKNILAQHYSNPNTWTDMCEYLL